MAVDVCTTWHIFFYWRWQAPNHAPMLGRRRSHNDSAEPRKEECTRSYLLICILIVTVLLAGNALSPRTSDMAMAEAWATRMNSSDVLVAVDDRRVTSTLRASLHASSIGLPAGQDFSVEFECPRGSVMQENRCARCSPEQFAPLVGDTCRPTRGTPRTLDPYPESGSIKFLRGFLLMDLLACV